MIDLGANSQGHGLLCAQLVRDAGQCASCGGAAGHFQPLCGAQRGSDA
ncbi:hypothetical protein [Paraburkholderia acidiphila]|uniref:Uncharacterized protein n=1 Tax=Paraburkholderia acidiphila TaxID=2571747 RepID=A0A7Z2J6N8_9BURK|nr:hypothetical protein [Paraburkholderia acidiphila]QGZ53632.1 hypothetical protein FAZ97_01205 [Paraburkholderia acidiphila]